MTPDDRGLEGFLAIMDLIVRARSIHQVELLAPPYAKSERERWDEVLLVPGDAVATVANALPDVVDDVLFHVLLGIDNEDWKLSWERASGERVDLAHHGRGEMAGWYVGANGWRIRYSQERADEKYPDGVEFVDPRDLVEGEDFGRAFVEQVRDPAIRAGVATARDAASSVGRLLTGDPAESFQTSVIELVDLVLKVFLDAMDTGRLRVWWHAESGDVTDLQGGDLVRRFDERRRRFAEPSEPAIP